MGRLVLTEGVLCSDGSPGFFKHNASQYTTGASVPAEPQLSVGATTNAGGEYHARHAALALNNEVVEEILAATWVSASLEGAHS